MPDPVTSSSDAELRDHVQRVLSAHYEVDCEIGRGGMGIVYRARDARLKRLVAVKLLPPELAFRSEIRSRFLREAETSAQLSHPNIVPIYSVDEREGLVYFIMGYIDGGNLATRLVERGSMDPEETRRILREVADALAFAHGRNLVHRDIKPDNILLSAEDGRAIVTDFGIARAVSEGADSRLTATGIAIGTPTYMSPEQAAGERDIDGRTDLYSLGIVGYQMLCGSPPFSANSTPALLVKHLSETPVPIGDRCPHVPPDLARAVMLLLEKDPANRFPSAAALVAALDDRRLPAEMMRTQRTATAATGRQPFAPPTANPLAGLPAPGPSYAPSHGPSHAPAPAPGMSLASAEEQARWQHPKVVKFRKAVTPYLFVNGAIILMSIFTGFDIVFVTAIWSIFMAYEYAKLWTEGYDWRDVFKQPRDRLILDVAAETIDDATALFDPKKRDQVRERERQRRARTSVTAPHVPQLPPYGGGAGARSAGGDYASPNPYAPSPAPDEGPVAHGDYAGAVKRAMADRDEIMRLLASMDKRERERLGDVQGSANAIVDAVEQLALSLAEAERGAPHGDVSVQIEREITQLEAAANPLDRTASEERVRRLAHLKRQRRALLDAEQRTQRDALRLDTCMVALQSLRYDLVRLKQGTQAPQQVTLLAERAMSLANDVDGLVLAADLARGGAATGAHGAARGSGV